MFNHPPLTVGTHKNALLVLDPALRSFRTLLVPQGPHLHFRTLLVLQGHDCLLVHRRRRRAGTLWPHLGLGDALHVPQHILAKPFCPQLVQKCSHVVSPSQPLNLLLIPGLIQRPPFEIKELSLFPTAPPKQSNQQNTENTGTMLASPAMQQSVTPSSQM